MRANTQWIVQLHSPSDKLIPVEEGRFVADKLKSNYMIISPSNGPILMNIFSFCSSY